MQQSSRQLARLCSLKQHQIASYTPHCTSEPLILLQRFILAILKRDLSEQAIQTMKKFVQYMLDARNCRIGLEMILAGIEEITFMFGDYHGKLYQFEPDRKAFCIHGKSISVYKRKIKVKNTQQEFEERSSLTQQIESTLFRMFHDGQLIIPKAESHQECDILMQYDLSDQSIEPITQSVQTFSPFIVNPAAIVMVLPQKLPRPQQLIQFMRSSLLHVYIDQCNPINKICYREVFYKNSTFKGIYFIEQGEVEVQSGRIVARGWVVNGKCRNSGYGWKFKPLPFLKFIARNEHIWKQFQNDLQLNGEYPFHLSHFLNLPQDPDPHLYKGGRMESSRYGKTGTRLPKIGHMSFDYGKFAQIQKVKHYDDRIEGICQFKKRLLERRLGGEVKSAFDAIVPADDDASTRRRNAHLVSKQANSQEHLLKDHRKSSSQNILIMSVLKKLEGMTEHITDQSNKSVFPQQRRNMKISPLMLHEKGKAQNRKKRYNIL